MVYRFLYILWRYRGNNSHRETNLLRTFTSLALCELPVTTDSKEEKSQAVALCSVAVWLNTSALVRFQLTMALFDLCQA
jgi:hypothetical protein